MTKRKIGALFGTALLIASAVAIAVRNHRRPMPPQEADPMSSLSAVRVKAVERKMEPVAEGEVAAASGAVAIVCGEDAATGRGNSRLGLSNPDS